MACRVRWNFEQGRQGSSFHAEEENGAANMFHLCRRIFSLVIRRRQDQGSRDLFSGTCGLQAEGNCATAVVDIVLLVRQFRPRVLLRARRVRRSPFPPWGLGGLLRRRRYNIRPSRKLISKRKAAAAAQDATERECWWAPPTIWGQ